MQRRIAIIGGGPAGLTCAYALKRRGLDSVVFEAAAAPGGRCEAGIPYLLGPEVFRNTFQLIADLGLSQQVLEIPPHATSWRFAGFSSSRARYKSGRRNRCFIHKTGAFAKHPELCCRALDLDIVLLRFGRNVSAALSAARQAYVQHPHEYGEGWIWQGHRAVIGSTADYSRHGFTGVSEWESGMPKFPPGRYRQIAAFQERSRRPGLFFCGDYLMGPLLEGAITTGLHAAHEIQQQK